MSIRDPFRPRPDSGFESAREPTQSLDLDLDRESEASLAVGTTEERTKVDSPNARNNPVVAKRAPSIVAPRDPVVVREPRVEPRPPSQSNADDPELRSGDVLGAYRLTELLGKGGMGYVYRAEHIKLGREVALKLLRGDYARRREAVNRFFQEAKTVNRVRHRNIVDVTDFVELDDGTTFIIMELLRGTSLGKWATTPGVDLARVLAVLIQICDGLGAAHAVGVVHRDLKPDNLVVTTSADGTEIVKLLDFGVAKLVNRDDEDVGFQTQVGSVIGTPAYMSPEQAGGMVVDQRSDIYSLGAIMYELLCGQPLFRGRSFGEFVRKHLTELPIPPRQTPGGANLDPRLEALILRCLAKEPDERFAHILELRAELGALASGGGMELPPMLAFGAMSSGAHSAPHTIGPPSGNNSSVLPAPASRWIWIAGSACVVTLGIGLAVWRASRPDEIRPPAPPIPVPIAMPIVTEPLTIPPTLIELEFDSLPSGGVFADGRSAELCSTPCKFNVDLKDGEATDRRTFVVRSTGYRDKPVTVDFAGTQREFHVTLERLDPAPPDPIRKHGKRPFKSMPIKHDDALEDPTKDTSPARRQPGSSSAR